MADPLTMLRDVLMKGQQPVIEGEEYIFGKSKFNKNVPTAFKNSANNTYYTLQAVHLCYVNRDVGRGVYVLQVARAGTTAVAVNDRKELLAYLDGEVETSTSIVYDTSSSLMSSQSQVSDSSIMGTQIPTGDQSISTTSTTTGAESMQIDDYSFNTTNASTGITSSSIGDFGMSSGGVDDYGTGMSGISSYDAQYRTTFIPEIDFNDEMSNEKNNFKSHLSRVPSKPSESYSIKDSENQFMEDIGNKRKAASMEKSNFMIADESITKMILAREKITNDRASVLTGTSSFLDILEKYNQFKKDEKKPSSSSSSSSSSTNTATAPNNSSSSSSSSRLSSNSSHHKSSVSSTLNETQIGSNRTPIIIVPSSLTTSLSIFNAQDFLQNAKWTSSIEKKNQLSSQNISKPTIITFDRIGTPKITYEIYDNIKLLKQEDWPRVAAVFVQGEAWQFKDWKWSTPVDILSQVRGFYLKLDDTTVPESVKSWDVKILHISRQKRHLDQTGQIEFWKAFDEFILTRKPYLNH